MKKLGIFLCLLLPLLVVCDFLFNFNKIGSGSGEHDYIAHAGGAWNGIIYTNSLEAVDNAIQKGLKYVELDLLLTSDGHLVCSHDWALLKQRALGVEGNDSALSYPEFKNLSDSIANKWGYHIITIEQVDSILNVHPDVYLVLDKISDPGIIEKNFSSLRNRLLIECFSLSDYYELKQLGYYQPMLSTRFRNRYYIGQRKRFFQSGYWSFPNTYTTHKDGYISNMQKDWIAHCPNAEYALFTCDNKAQADSIFNQYPNVRYIYVNNID